MFKHLLHIGYQFVLEQETHVTSELCVLITAANKVEPSHVEANLPLCFETLRRFTWSYHTTVAGLKVTEDSAENIAILSCHEIKVT